MSIKQKFAEYLIKLGQELKEHKFMAEATLEGGEMIMTPADEWAVGVEVFVAGEDGEPMPLPEGVYTTQEGLTITVENEGVVANIERMADEAENEEAAAEPKENVEQEAEKPKAVIETVSKEIKFEDIEKLQKTLADQQAVIELQKERIQNLIDQFAEFSSKTNEKFSSTADMIKSITDEITELKAPVEFKKHNPEGNKKVEEKPVNLAALTTEERVKHLMQKLKK